MIERHKTALLTVNLKKHKKNSVNAFQGNEWMKADTSPLRSTTQNKWLMVKITSILGSYRLKKIAWHDIFSLSDHFTASWNLYIPRDLTESKRKCSSSRQSNTEVNDRTHLKDSCLCFQFGKTSNCAVKNLLRKLWVWATNVARSHKNLITPDFGERVLLRKR